MGEAAGPLQGDAAAVRGLRAVTRGPGRAVAVIQWMRRPSDPDPASPRYGRARGTPRGAAGTGSSSCRAACPPRTRRASPRRTGRGDPRARPASPGPPTRMATLTRFEKSPPSVARTCRTIPSRERPPPRTPGRSSEETREAVSSNSAHAARRSRALRLNLGASNGSRSSGEGANEMPQKSVEPTPGYRSMMSRSVCAASSEPSRTRFATGRYRGT